VSVAVHSTFQRIAAALFVLAMVVACSAAPRAEADDAAATSVAADIRHITPAPDSVGPMPKRFEWSSVDGAQSYTLRIWNEVDVRMASATGLTTTSIDVSGDTSLSPGTYFWSVLAVRDGEVIAESGMAAFVVTE